MGVAEEQTTHTVARETPANVSTTSASPNASSQSQSDLGKGLRVVYSAPNREPHYGYARELYHAGILKTFVCGFPRYSPRSPIPEIGAALRRADSLQTLFIASQKLRLPQCVSEELAHWAKIQIDRSSRRPLRDADVFLFYNGCGLESARWFRANGGIGIVQAMNGHVLAQEQILAEEHKKLGLPWRHFHPREVRRRVTEVEEAEYVLVPSTFVAKSFLAKGIPAGRILQVPFTMQRIAGAAESARRNERDEKAFRVLCVASISVRKGLRYLIEAFRELKYPKKELWIVGPAANPSGLEDVSLPEGIKFFGPLKGDALQDVYSRATVFCLPSIEEGLALVLIEALYYGLPVIATENSGIEDLLANGRGAMMVPIRDARAISDWLNRLADDPNFLEQKRVEAVEARNRLANLLETGPNLAITLLKTFRRDRLENWNEPN
jgi:glycosyltransferase involved in cell wall biosynthesis